MRRQCILGTFNCESHIWQSIKIGAIRINDNFLKNWHHEVTEADDAIIGVHDPNVHILLLDNDVTFLDRVQLQLEVFLVMHGVLLDDLKVIRVHAGHDHVTLLWLPLEVQGESLVLGVRLMKEWIESADALGLRVVCKAEYAIEFVQNESISIKRVDFTKLEILRNEIAKSEGILRNRALDHPSKNVDHLLGEVGAVGDKG